MRIAGFSTLGVLCTLVMLSAPRSVRAGGLELLPGGTRSVARGGAVAARPEDAVGLLHNPAGLAYLKGDQLTFDLDFALREMCVDPYGFYGWGRYVNRASDFEGPEIELDDPVEPTAYETTPLAQVCNTGTQIPIPNLAWVGKFGDDFAFGGGFVAPTVTTGTRFGGKDGTIARADGSALPTPTRYAVIEQTAEASSLTVGAAYRIIPQLSLGATFTYLGLKVKSRVIQNAQSGTQPSHDWLVDLEAEDYFLPTITLSAHAKPFPGLDIVGALRWVDDFDGSGKVVFETNTFQELGNANSVPYRNDAIELPGVRVGLPWGLTGAVRYAGLLPGGGSPEGLGDPMDTERWDIEVDGSYYLNSRGSQNQVRAGGDFSIVTRTKDGGGMSQPVRAEDLEDVSVDRHLKDSIAVRLGGSFALAPRQLAVHGGVFYENRGVEPAYVNIDNFALARVGFGLGFMWRVRDFDLTAAYGHIFQETVRIAPPEHQDARLYDTDKMDPLTGFDKRVGGTFDAGGNRVGGVVLEDPDAPSPGDADAVARLQQTSVLNSAPRVINAGEYTASFNIISVGAVYHW